MVGDVAIVRVHLGVDCQRLRGSEAGGWTTAGEATEASTDAGACDAGEAATGATANDGVAVAGSDCTTA